MSKENSEEKNKISKDDKGISKYVKERLQDQQEWYCEKASLNKKRFMRFQTTIIILGALIPLIVVFDNFAEGLFGKLDVLDGLPGLISAIIAATIAILAGIDKLTQPQTNWFNYRSNEEMLKKEEWMYHYLVGPYKGLSKGDAEKQLVERVESVISADIARFAQAEYKKEEDTVSTAKDKKQNNTG